MQLIPDSQESVAMSDFARRQTPESQFSHYTQGEESLLLLVAENFSKYKVGYREGVVLVPVDPEHFYSGIAELKAGDKLTGVYEARREGEEPRKSVFKANGEKLPAKFVEVVLYHKDVLAEDNDRSTEADWEIVSINASPIEKPVPISPGALIANHFHLSGGTQTNMTDEEFAAMLKESTAFWSKHALVTPKESGLD